jgi:DNA-directed RNA polymerase subunit M/transcription elongation factor TFIIS
VEPWVRDNVCNLTVKLLETEESEAVMAKIAKTADRKKVMDTSKSTDCPKCGKATRIVKRVKDRERGVPGGIFISCSACEFYEKL